MKTNGGLVLIGFAVAVMGVACAAAPTADRFSRDDNEVSSRRDKDDDDEDDDDKDSTSSSSSSSSSGSTPAPTAPPTPTAPPAPSSTAPPPNPNAQACGFLSACCATLFDNTERLGCVGTALAGDDDICATALLVCQGGGTGLGGGSSGKDGTSSSGSSGKPK